MNAFRPEGFSRFVSILELKASGYEGVSARNVFSGFCDAGGGSILGRVYDGGYKDSHAGYAWCFNKLGIRYCWESKKRNISKIVGYQVYMLFPNVVMQYFEMLDFVEAECMVEA